MHRSRHENDAPRPWPLLGRDEAADYEMFRVVRIRTRSPMDDTERTFHVCESADGVTALALTAAGELVMVEQFRHPLRRVTLEPPAGVVEDGEDPLTTALRELREETGYDGGDAEYLGSVVVNPSWQTTRLHVVLVRGARPAGEKDEDETEETRVRTMAWPEVRRLVAAGEIQSATAIAAFALLDWTGRAPADDRGGA